jgi:hypothetical protein
VRGNLQPFPYFETFSISLQNGKKILMVVIPPGENTPYIHKDGRIYRRNASASDPVPETDRHVFDMLYERSEEYEKKLEEFRQIDYSFCEAETKPHLAIFINTKPFNYFKLPDLSEEVKIKEILEKFSEKYTIIGKIEEAEITLSGAIPFNTFNTYGTDSICIRQMLGSDLAFNGLTVEIDGYGNAKILIPLNKVNLDFENPTNEIEKKYIDLFKKNHPESLQDIVIFLDGINIFGAVVGLIDRYSMFLISHGYKDDFEIKIRLINCWRTTLYFPSNNFLKHIENFDIPVCMKSEQYLPEIPYQTKIEKIQGNPLIEPLTVFSLISNALGLPSTIAFSAILEKYVKTENL